MLAQELRAKGVSSDDIARALGVVEPEDELNALVRLVRKKRRIPRYADMEVLVAYFARQGYDYGLLKKAIECIDDADG